jgi:uncharacterized protein
MNLSEHKRRQIEENRRRYEQLKAAGQDQSPQALPPLTSRGAGLGPEAAVMHRETVPGGWYCAVTLAEGESLRIVNSQGTSSVSMVAWNRHDTSERLNHADSIKVQWTAQMRSGRVLLSDMGRVLLSLVEDTSGAHDSLVGGSTAASNLRKYGAEHRNTRDNLILGATKLGLSRRDIPPCVTFFAPVAVDETGRFFWQEGALKAGDFIDLRAAMDVVVLLSNCPHPLDPAAVYAPGDVEVIHFTTSASDFCRTVTPEAVRAYENTDAVRVA